MVSPIRFWLSSERTVTVAATREEVARLAQAAATGKLALSLVSEFAGETGLIEVNGNSLLGIEDQPEVVAAVPEMVCTVKTRKGAELIDTGVSTPCTN